MKKIFIALIICFITTSLVVSAVPPVARTFWSWNGNSKLNGQPVPAGTVIKAYDPDGVLCGQYTVITAGEFSFDCAGDDPDTPADEGGKPGDIIKFYMNNWLATVTGGSAEWQSGYQEVNIEATSGCTTDNDCNNLDTECADGVCNTGTGQCYQQFKPSTTVCRASGGACDIEEKCTGSSATCPADSVRPDTYECRASAGICDIAEKCDGTNKVCPSDAFRPNTYECRASAGVCDIEEKCTGTNANCPADAKSTAQCRAAVDACDLAENCDGTNNNCPADAKAPAGTQCGSARDCPADACNGFFAQFYPADGQDTCNGAGACVVYSCAMETSYCTDSDGTDGVNTIECNAPCDQNKDCDDSDPNTIDTCAVDCTCKHTREICDNSIDDDGDGLIDCSDADCAGQTGPGGAICCQNNDNCDSLDKECADGVCDLGTKKCIQQFKPSTTVCRASGGICDLEEKCTGSSANCPVDSVRPNTYECRASAGTCDIAEKCDGSTKACPADVFQPSTTVCRASGGICDIAEKCTGTNANCPSDAKSTAQCRAASGECDIAENCDGTNNNCPADAKASAGTLCGQARDCPADACNGFFAQFYPADGQDTCNGAGACVVYSCAMETSYCTDSDGTDGVNTIECNAPCDQNKDCDDSDPNTIDTCAVDCTCKHTREICDNSIDDDGDGLIDCSDADCAGQTGPGGAICCQNNDNCDSLDKECADGVCNLQTHKCTQQFKPSTTVCRASGGACDLEEKCTGTSATCPADSVRSNTYECRAVAGDCDLAENCDGTNKACPTDSFKPSTTVCRAQNGVCDLEEKCTGSSATCPVDSVRPNTYECRAAVDACDLAENCDGTNNNCPADAKAPAGTQCGSARDCPADACNGFFAQFYPADGQDTCNGAGACVVYSCAMETSYCTDSDGTDGVNTLECNAPCDQNKDCDDSDPNTIDTCAVDCTCKHTREICDNSIDDDGDGLIDCNDADCAGQTGPGGAICCQNNDNCDSLDKECADGVCNLQTHKCTQQFKPSTTVCRASGGACDLEEKCTGSSANCPADSVRPNTYECRASVGICDIAEKCDGDTKNCPADVFKPEGTDCGICAVCDETGSCGYDETQDSDCSCPADKCTDKNNDGIIDAYNDYGAGECQAINTCKNCGLTIIEPDIRCLTTMKIPIEQYVSMFSLPLVPATPVTFNDIQSGCTFTGDITDGIAYWDPLKAGTDKYVYIDANTILYPGQGYFTTQEDECSFTIKGYKFTTKRIGRLGSDDIYNGWNMIGAPSEIVNNFDLVEGTCSVVSGPWGFDAADYEYVRTQKLEPGKGYFVKTTNNCNLG